jgi:hypothetical protein
LPPAGGLPFAALFFAEVFFAELAMLFAISVSLTESSDPGRNFPLWLGGRVL